MSNPTDGRLEPGESGEPDVQAVDTLKPSAMRGTELRYGVAVAVILVVIAVLNLVIRHGAGAPKHPQTGLAVIGLIASLAVFPLLRTRNRFIVPFAALVAALLVSLPSGPNQVKSLHAVVIIFPFAYALLLTQRQRKAAMAQARLKAANRSANQAATATSRPSTRGGRRRRNVEQPTGPTANRRYTPPKPKRARR